MFSDGSPGEQVLAPMMMDRGGRKKERLKTKKAEVAVAPPRTTRGMGCVCFTDRYRVTMVVRTFCFW